METDLVALVAGDTALSALVGTRIAWNAVPQGEADPNIALFQVVSGAGYTTHGADDLQRTVVQANIRALTYTSALAVRDALRARVSGYRGRVGATQFGGIFIRAERHRSEKPNDILFHQIQVDIEIWSRSAA